MFGNVAKPTQRNGDSASGHAKTLGERLDATLAF